MKQFPILRVEKVPEMVVKALSKEHEIISYADIDENTLCKITDNIQIVLGSGESKVTSDLIDKLPNLKLIAIFGVGYDGVDVEYATKKGIHVTNTPNVLTDDVADLGIGLMIATARQFTGLRKFIERNKWGKSAYPLTTKVTGKTLGIVGFGRIGQAVAKRAKAFDMNIIYTSIEKVEYENAVYYKDVISLAKDSDFLIVCASGGAGTKHLINQNVLNALGKDGFLINISRGSLVNEKALVYSLENKIIAGAGMDVLENEPYIPEKLLSMDNVVITPHIGSGTVSSRTEMTNIVCNNVKLFTENKPLLTSVNCID